MKLPHILVAKKTPGHARLIADDKDLKALFLKRPAQIEDSIHETNIANAVNVPGVDVYHAVPVQEQTFFHTSLSHPFVRGRGPPCKKADPPELGAGARLFPRDVERVILNESPPAMAAAQAESGRPGRGVRVEFLGDDGKGYLVTRQGEGFIRRNEPYKVMRVVLRDQPFLFFRAMRVLDEYEAEIQQSLITTIGNRVVDYFYLLPEVYDRLERSGFEERFIGLMQGDTI